MQNSYVEREGPEWAVFRVANDRIHCLSFFASRHEAEIRKARLNSIRLVTGGNNGQS